MSVLSQQNDGGTAQAENTDVSLNCGDDNKVRICSLPQVRKKKILEVRQQLIEDRYDINGRLNLVLDHLLEDFVT